MLCNVRIGCRRLSVISHILIGYNEMLYVKSDWLLQLLEASEWMVYSDCVNRVVGQTQNYDMARTLPLLPVAVHLLMACNAPMTLKYPHSQFEVCLRVPLFDRKSKCTSFKVCLEECNLRFI